MSKVLSLFEHDILQAFFSLYGSESFVLTGGAALAEYYFLMADLNPDKPASE
jgi:hypothetical protein